MPRKKTNETSDYLPLLFEIRKRILIILIVFISATTLGAIFYEKIVTLFLNLLALEGATIIFTSPFEYMNLAFNSGLIIGIIIALPIVLYHLIAFLRPALTDKEFKIFLKIIPLSIVLFLSGFAVGFVMMKYVGQLSYQTSKEIGISSYLNISNLLSTVLLTSSLMGLAFQFPIALVLLVRLNIVSYKFLVDKRPFAYIAAMVFAALMPPTDILSMILLALPLVILYELVVFFSKNL
jgi:sec-independent protein translocase protein TatC